MAYFIETESLEQNGEAGEKKVWEVVKKAFRNSDCLGYWRYPVFSSTGKGRKEPDILIADKSLGLLVLEVKAINIQNIITIQGHQWQMRDFYSDYIQPYRQAENQLYAVAGWCDTDPIIRRRVAGRAVVALPYITRGEWEGRGFDKLPSSPPILFRGDLRLARFYEQVETIPPLIQGQALDDEQWEAFQVALCGSTVLKKDTPGDSPDPESRRAIIDTVREKLIKFDLQQERIGKQIPPGIQRIRGIAGSGKTVLLAQRAVHMHLKYPDWNIALIFFTRSLYDQIINLIDKWMRHFTQGEQSYNQQNSNLKVYHAWGSKTQPGFYREACLVHKVRPLIVNDIKELRLTPNDGLIYVCQQFLKQVEPQRIFDAILIDEGQDLVTDNESLLFDDKQSFYWFAYSMLRWNGIDATQRRLYWAYDEAQSLTNLTIPQYKQIFGEDLGKRLTKGVSYKGGIKKSEVMPACYRTPGPIITAAHALGMGLLRPNGMLTAGLTTKLEWEQLGYNVLQGEFREGNKIVLQRPEKNSPNPVPQFWHEYVFQFRTYRSRAKEIEALTQHIKRNIHEDKLKPCREILVLVLGTSYNVPKLTRMVAKRLQQTGIDVFIPSAKRLNDLAPRWPNNDPNQFWHEGGVTISNIHRAKGNEADMVYVIGVDNIARKEEDMTLRNQLFVGLTRSKAWVHLSGVGQHPLFDEIKRVISCGDTFEFVFRRNK